MPPQTISEGVPHLGGPGVESNWRTISIILRETETSGEGNNRGLKQHTTEHKSQKNNKLKKNRRYYE
jgi:hypothetical protein